MQESASPRIYFCKLELRFAIDLLPKTTPQKVQVLENNIVRLLLFLRKLHVYIEFYRSEYYNKIVVTYKLSFTRGAVYESEL